MMIWMLPCWRATRPLSRVIRRKTIKYLWLYLGDRFSRLTLSVHISTSADVSCVSSSPDPVHRSPGHLRLWGLWKQQLWTVLHQLRQRKAPALLQPTHLQIRTGRVVFSSSKTAVWCYWCSPKSFHALPTLFGRQHICQKRLCAFLPS